MSRYNDKEVIRKDDLRMQEYYSSLSAVSFPTVFVPLTEEELSFLAKGEKDGKCVEN